MSVLKTIDKVITKLEEYIVSYSIIIMAAILVVSVIARKVFNNSLTYSEEAGQFLMVILTFIGTSYAVRKGSHINMSAVLDFAPFKLKKALTLFISFCTMVLMFVFAYFGYEYLLTVIARGRVTPALEIPRYFITMFLPIGFTLAGIQYLINFILNIKDKDEIYLGNDMPESEKELETDEVKQQPC